MIQLLDLKKVEAWADFQNIDVIHCEGWNKSRFTVAHMENNTIHDE